MEIAYFKEDYNMVYVFTTFQQSSLLWENGEHLQWLKIDKNWLIMTTFLKLVRFSAEEKDV